MPRYMLDTNALNGVLDYCLAGNAFHGEDLFVTHIQRDELSGTTDIDRRSALLDVVQVLDADSMPTVGAVFDVSRFDECEWTPSDGSLQSIFDEITAADQLQGKKSSDVNRWRDALILETSLRRLMTLVTNDGGLTKVALQKGVPVMSLEALLVSIAFEDKAMFQIKNLPFDLLKPVERISSTAHGAILSIQSDTYIGVGLRTRTDYPDNANEALLLIGGSHHGAIMSLNALKHPSAIDISDLVEFVANQPSVLPAHRAEKGTLMRRKDKIVFAVVADAVYDGESFNTAYISLSNEGDIKLGSALPGMNPDLWLRVAPSFDVAWKKEYRHLGLAAK